MTIAQLVMIPAPFVSLYFAYRSYKSYKAIEDSYKAMRDKK